METTAAANTQIVTVEKSSFKDKVLYSLLAAAGIAGGLFLGEKLVKKFIANRSDAKSFEDGTPETIAKQIKMTFENDDNFGTDVPALRQILTDIKSREQLNRVYTEYKKQFNKSMYNDMYKELQTSEYNEMLQIIAGKPEKEGQKPTSKQYLAWAIRLKSAFDKTYSFIPGTDEPAIKAVFLEIPTQAAFVEVGKEYMARYGVNLMTALKGELEFWELPDYLQMLAAKPKV